MTATALLPRAHVRAIREDAISLAEEARRRAGLLGIYTFVRRGRLRLGDQPVRDVLHMAAGDFNRMRQAGPALYRKRPPICRDCGRPIEHGERVIAFGLRPSRRFNPHGRDAFIHEEPCS